MGDAVRPWTVILVGLGTFGLVFGGLSQCSEKCPDGCGPPVLVSWGPDVLPDEGDFVEVCVEECTELEPADASAAGSAAWVGVLPKRGAAVVTFTVYSGEGGGTALTTLTAEAVVEERCGCRNLRLRVTDDGHDLTVL